MDIYLINLDRSKDRLANATRQLTQAGLPFQRVEAVDGSKLDQEKLIEYNARDTYLKFGRFLKVGELGCFLSHVDCARRFLDTDQKHCLVLEDDFHAEPKAFEGLSVIQRALDNSIVANWHVMNLGYRPKRFTKPLLGLPNAQLVHAPFFPVTTTALLWSREGAEAFLDQAKEITMPVDLALQKQLCVSGRGLASLPPLFDRMDTPSEIDVSQVKTPRGGSGVRPRYTLLRIKRLAVNNVSAIINAVRRPVRNA